MEERREATDEERMLCVYESEVEAVMAGLPAGKCDLLTDDGMMAGK